MLEVPGVSGREGGVFCLTACNCCVSSSLSEEKVWRYSPVDEGDGRGDQKMSRKRDASSEVNKSGLKNCDVSRSCVQILCSEDEEPPQDVEDTHSTPTGSGEVGKEVTKVYRTRFRGHSNVAVLEPKDLGEISCRTRNFEKNSNLNFYITYPSQDHLQNFNLV